MSVEQISTTQEADIDLLCSAKHPRLRYIDTRASWDGVYRRFNRKTGRLSRAFLCDIVQLCEEKEYPYQIIDERSSPKVLPPSADAVMPDILPGITLFDHQLRAIKATCQNEIGLISSTTGSGKSEMMAAITKIFRCNTIIVADYKIIIDQLKETLELREVAEEVGMFYAGKTPTNQTVVIGTIQSLVPPPSKLKAKKPVHYASRLKRSKLLRDIVGKCDLLLVDECVHEDSWIPTDGGVMKAKELYKLLDAKRVKAHVAGGLYEITGKSEKVGKTLCITTNRGRKLSVSPNHEMAIFNGGLGYKHARDIKKGDMLLSSRREALVDRNDDFYRWHVVGLFVGDGHFQNNKVIKFAFRKDIDAWEQMLSNYVGNFGGTLDKSGNERGDTVFRLRSRRLISTLKSLGFRPGKKTGSMRMDFTIPNESSAAGFLCGLFDAEGSSYRDKAKFDVVDEELVRLGQYLLSYLGINSSVMVGNKRHGEYYHGKNHAPTWRLSVSGEDYRLFNEKIGFCIERKRKLYKNRLSSDRKINKRDFISSIVGCGFKASCLLRYLGISKPGFKDKISLSTFINIADKIENIKIHSYRDASRIIGISDKKIGRHYNIPTATVWHRRKKGNDSLWRAYVKHILDKARAKVKHDSLLRHYTIERVTKVSSGPRARLIDFSVDSSKCFEANGLLVHNCDRATSKQFRGLFTHWFTGRRRFGFSGTPFDPEKPVENLFLREFLGNIISHTSREEVQDCGLIVPIKYITMAIGRRSEMDKSALDIATNENMVESEKFHELVADIVEHYKNEKTLILVELVDLGVNLLEAISKRGVDAEFIYGKTSNVARTRAKKKFESGKLKCLIGGKILKRGLDLKGGTHNLIVCNGGKLWSDFNQRIGRAVRRNDKGWARVFDFFFLNNHYLYKHSKARLRSLIDMGYDATVVFGDQKIKGEKLVKSNFRFPAKIKEKYG